MSFAYVLYANIEVLCNLSLLNDEIIDSLKDANINSLQVSVYSINPDEHDYITQLKGSHEKIIRNIGRLIEADIPVQISYPTMRSTYRFLQRSFEVGISSRHQGLH